VTLVQLLNVPPAGSCGRCGAEIQRYEPHAYVAKVAEHIFDSDCRQEDHA